MFQNDKKQEIFEFFLAFKKKRGWNHFHSDWKWLTTALHKQKWLIKKSQGHTLYRTNSCGNLVPFYKNVCQLIADTQAWFSALQLAKKL